MGGYAGNLIQSNEDMHIEKVCSDSIYSQCSKSLANRPTGRKRVFCSDECRKVLIKEHPVPYKYECMFCGKEFEI